jgi:hypothetical protein
MLTELRRRGVICSDLSGLLVLIVWYGHGVQRSIGAGRIVGAGHVDDDRSGLGFFLFCDGGKGAEELVGDVGKDGGAPGEDFVLREEEEQTREEVVDLGGGGEVVEVGGEGGGDFGGVGLSRSSGLSVLGTERLAAEAGQATTHTVGKAMVAAGRVIDGAGFSELRSHWWFPLKVKWFDTRGFCIDEKTNGLRKEGFVS